MGLYHEILHVLYCPGVHGVLEVVESLDEKSSSEQLLMATYSADHKRLSISLHHILTMTTKGKALRVVQQADPGN